ncbi:hypothetical protein [Gordonia iterans]
MTGIEPVRAPGVTPFDLRGFAYLPIFIDSIILGVSWNVLPRQQCRHLAEYGVDPVEAREVAGGERCGFFAVGVCADLVADGLCLLEVVHAGLDAAAGGSVPSVVCSDESEQTLAGRHESCHY